MERSAVSSRHQNTGYSADERAAIAEIEATKDSAVSSSDLMQICLLKFTDQECGVFGLRPAAMGINVDDVLDLETTLCSEFCINPIRSPLDQPERLFVSRRPVVKVTPSKATPVRRPFWV